MIEGPLRYRLSVQDSGFVDVGIDVDVDVCDDDVGVKMLM